MAKQTQRHNITDALYVYQQANSRRWYARLLVNGKWYTKATKQRELTPAIGRAIELQAEYKIKIDHDIPVVTARANKHKFSTVANYAIARMEDAISAGSGKVIFRDYIQALEKYHKKYFSTMLIKNIDAQKLLSFDAWRVDQLGRMPAKSTVLTHNSAMQRVFDEAVIRNIITATELPKLKNKGLGGQRRASFTRGEYFELLASAKDWIAKGKKKITRDTRTLLYYYIQFAALTGARPGTEIDGLTWGDICKRSIKNEEHTFVIVQKGKTTLYTGVREIVGGDGIDEVLKGMKSTLQKSRNADLIFTLPDGSQSSEIGKNFSRLLDLVGLKYCARGDRTLYSLRHSYITWQLENETELVAIAKQCGTSIQMIERHYSHVVPAMFAKQLSGKGRTLHLNSLTPADVSNLLKTDDGILMLKDRG